MLVWLVYPHDIIGEIIDVFEGFGEDPAHAAILMPDREGKQWVWEAVRGGFRQTEVNTYDSKRVMEYFVPTPDSSAPLAKAEELLGNDYGYLSCAEGVLYNALNIPMTQNGEAATNCSESVTIIARAGGALVCEDIPASCVTPRGLKEYFDASGILGILRC